MGLRMRNRRVAGFTLLELTIVLVIVAIITGMGLISTLGVLESARRAATENKLNEIEKALMAFRVANGRLPCPFDLYHADTSAFAGLESEPPGTCLTSHVW